MKFIENSTKACRFFPPVFSRGCMKGQDSMTSTSLVTPCFEKKFVTNIQRLKKTKYEIPQSRLRITTYEFLNPMFQCTHVIANSSLNIADQERRERNPDNKKDQLKTTLHNTRTFYCPRRVLAQRPKPEEAL